MKKEEAKELNNLDLAYEILKREKKGKTTKELFKQVCDLLDYTENQYLNMVGDFYTSLNLDKRFVLLDNKWELKENHSINTIISDELDDLDEIDIETIDDIDEDEEEIEIYDDDEEIVEEVDIDEEEEKTELDGMTVIDEEDIE